jgi:hypothetical protein
MKSYVSLLIGFLLLSSTAFAQFTGPSATGRISTVTEARNAPVEEFTGFRQPGACLGVSACRVGNLTYLSGNYRL